MIKYAMVPICGKMSADDQPIIRRALISYEERVESKVGNVTQVFYKNTKLIDKDPYFTKKSASHKYKLTDDYFVLQSSPYSHTTAGRILTKTKRPYHYNILPQFDPLYPPAIEFTAETEEKAKKLFHARKEMRD